MTRSKRGLLLAYYGDDLTGSTDSLEALVLAGVRAVLFLDPPGPADMAEHPEVEAIGVAGMTRAMRTPAMARALRPAFAALAALRPRHVHYKICSTFDSTPRIGSIGRAIDLGWEAFRPRFVPLLGGAPALGRYCAFGNLFARVGIGTGGAVHRLDRLAAMARHAVTPVGESDLRLHVGAQTRRPIELFDLLRLGLAPDLASAELDRLIDGGAEVVLFDALSPEDVRRVGELVDDRAGGRRPLFSVGPSSVEVALGSRFAVAGGRRPPPRRPAPADGPVLVASGSCSPVTAAQIAFALGNGFGEAALDLSAALGEGEPGIDGRAVDRVLAQLRRGRSVVLHSSRGAADPRVATARKLGKKRSWETDALGFRLGTCLGLTVREILRQAPLRRVIVAGGDTSSHAARALGVRWLRVASIVTPGGPLCRVGAPGSPIDGCEVIFKGGQVGGPDYFGRFDPAVARRRSYA